MKIVRNLFYSENFILILSIFFLLVLLPFFPRIISVRNLANLASNLWPLFALVVGQMFVLIIGGIDLSQTSIMAVASVAGGLLITDKLNPILFEKSPLWGILISPEGGLLAGSIMAVPLAILTMLLIGAFIGALNGYFVAKFNMPPFMVTLVAMMFFSGLALYLTKSENIMYLPEGYIALGKGGLGFISYAFMIASFIGLVSHIILQRSVVGRWFYAVGKNIKTAAVSGVPTRRVVILAYTFSTIGRGTTNAGTEFIAGYYWCGGYWRN
jgi:ribose/xylose/arabinose/galactoside ABC-type transport system permease subunit